MKLVTVWNSENIYYGYDATLRRSILDVLELHKIPYRDKWRASPAGGLWQRDRFGQSTSDNILYRVDVRKGDADTAIHLLKQAGVL